MVLLPPETLYDIVALAVLGEVDAYIRGATKKPRNDPYSPASDIPSATTGTRGFTDTLALLRVSSQFRDITFKIIYDAFHFSDLSLAGYKLRETIDDLRQQWATLGRRPDLDMNRLLLTPPHSIDDLDAFKRSKALLIQAYILAAHMRAIAIAYIKRPQMVLQALGGGGGVGEVGSRYASRASPALRTYGSRLEALIGGIRPSLFMAVRDTLLEVAQEFRDLVILSETTIEVIHNMQTADNPFTRILACVDAAKRLGKLSPIVENLDFDEEAIRLVQEYDPSRRPIPAEVKNAMLTLQRQVDERNAANGLPTA